MHILYVEFPIHDMSSKKEHLSCFWTLLSVTFLWIWKNTVTTGDFRKGFILPYGCIKKAHIENVDMKVCVWSRKLRNPISATQKK